MNKIGYLIKEGFFSIFSHGFMSFASVCVIIACLIIMGSFSLVAVNVDANIEHFEAQNQIMAFIDEEMSQEEARALESQILAVPNVREVQFMTREEAMDNFSAQYEDSALFESVDSDTFRDRYTIYLDDITQMEQTQRELYKIYGVAKVNAHLEVAQGFITVRNVVSAVSLVLIVILVIVSIFIMANTIKLTTFGRREEITIMKMVGASNGFIRFPFIVEGLILGLVGGGVAFFAQWGIYALLTDRIMAGMLGSLVVVVSWSALLLPLLLIFLLIGVLVGMFGGLIAIRNYLKV